MSLLLPKFEYLEPRDLSEACSLMGEHGGNIKVIAGGTDILVNMKKGLLAPKYLMGVSRVDGLSEAGPQNGSISIGPCLIVAKLTEFDLIKKKLPVLAKAASVLGSPLVRNRATLGGNIVTARPAADLPPPLLALGAKVALRNAKGTRIVPLDGFFTGPGQTVMGPDELLTAVIVDEPPPFTGSEYLKLGHRNVLEISIVAVAARITMDKPDGVIKEARIVLSAVAPTAIRAPKAEGVLVGEKPSESLFARAGEVAGTECSPITDIRGGAEYRCAMVETLTRRALTSAARSVTT